MNMVSGRWIARAVTDIAENSPLPCPSQGCLQSRGSRSKGMLYTTAAALQSLVLRLKMIYQAANSWDWNTDTHSSLSHLQVCKSLAEGSCCELGDQYWGSERSWRANLCRQATTFMYVQDDYNRQELTDLGYTTPLLLNMHSQFWNRVYYVKLVMLS